jgi:hypothetical protein
MDINDAIKNIEFNGESSFIFLKDICDKNYTLFGEGCTRYVYDIGTNYVIKIAKNMKGIYQNECECRLTSKFKKYNVILPIIENSTEYLWVVQKKVQPIFKNMELFIEYYKITFQDIELSINKCNNFLSRNWKLEYSENLYLNNLEHFLIDAQMTHLSDLLRLDNWGYDDNNIYIIDYGLDKISYKKHVGGYYE